MRTIDVRGEPPDPAEIARAAEVIRSGGLVAFPTETVYGLGANALDPTAVARIFEAKGRPAYNPLISHVSDPAAARRLSRAWPGTADRLAARFWPGPLTLVVPKADDVPDIVTAGLGSVAVRVPAHPVALALLRAAGLPIAAPSANRFTQVSPTTAEHVARGLGDRVDLILDGGPTGVGIESTVLDLTGDVPVLLRPGSLTVTELEAVVGPIARGAPITGDEARPSPGMVDRHYSPRAELRLYGPTEHEAVRALVETAREAGTEVGALVLDEPPAPVDHPVHMPPTPAAYARELYAALHRLDEVGCGLIIAESVPEGPDWAGVRDRLARAAAPGVPFTRPGR